MLGQAAQATISYIKLPQGNSCFPDDHVTIGKAIKFVTPTRSPGLRKETSISNHCLLFKCRMDDLSSAIFILHGTWPSQPYHINNYYGAIVKA